MALCLVPGLGPASWRKLADALGDPRHILSASRSQLLGAGASEKLAGACLSFSDWEKVDRNLAELDQLGAKIIGFGEDDYPEPLRRIHNPPQVLFVRGRLTEQDNIALAMVGTRHPGGYGKRIARKLAFQIASSGVTVVSGLAMGIDAQAHLGALDAKGRTIAVLGSGLDMVSPVSNEGLAEKIAQSGAVISEYPPGTAGFAGNFPQRNRIVAGLSSAVLIIAMPDKSGAGITAKLAVDQNKDVLVVPGPIDDQDFYGSHRWIRQGARPVFSAMDVLEVVLPDAALRMGRTKPLIETIEKTPQPLNLSVEQAKVFEIIRTDSIDVDQIAEQADLTIERTLTILLELELRNLVVQLPGKLFRAN